MNSTGKHPKCPQCRVSGYTQGVAPDGRPKFTCQRCGYWWTNGKDGGEYLVSATHQQGGHQP